MKTLVFSDTHGRINKTIELIDGHRNVDMIIHLGDLVRDAYDLQAIFKNIKFEYISGNNDFYSREPYEKIISLGSKKLLITHGHKYHVKYGMEDLKTRGKGLDGVLFGHTHQPYEEYNNGKLYFNPGSITFSRTYGIIEVNNDKLEWMLCRL